MASQHKIPAGTDNSPEAELVYLRTRLAEAEDTLDAIRHGSVDALVIKQSDTQQVYTLKSADYSYRVLIESMAQAAVTIGPDGTILYSNSQFGRMLNRPLQLVIGSKLQSFFNDRDCRLLDDLIHKGNKQRLSHISGPMSKDDLELELLVSPPAPTATVILSAMRLPASEPAYMGIVITDITERKRAEKAKDEFISLASHQLRTPATGVKQYLGMLLDGYAGELATEQRPFVNTAYNSNEKQLSIINSILKTAQIDSGVYTVTKTTQNLQALVNAVLVDFEPLLRMRRQKLVCAVDAALEAEVDGPELSLALSNLVENASKYSPNGKQVTIRASQTARQTVIRVSDQGVGIAATNLDSIFGKFTRIDNEMSDTVSGSGLGLYWVKRIIDMHHGSVAVVSTLGKGTTFSIKLVR